MLFVAFVSPFDGFAARGVKPLEGNPVMGVIFPAPV